MYVHIEVLGPRNSFELLTYLHSLAPYTYSSRCGGDHRIRASSGLFTFESTLSSFFYEVPCNPHIDSTFQGSHTHTRALRFIDILRARRRTATRGPVYYFTPKNFHFEIAQARELSCNLPLGVRAADAANDDDDVPPACVCTSGGTMNSRRLIPALARRRRHSDTH